jgi:chemotaxis protein MotB
MVEDSNDTQQPIIIKKKKRGHAGHHGGAWKVAYADFVTAMMALFLVMWIVGMSDEIKEAVAGYFRDPVGFAKGGSQGVLPGGSGPFEPETGRALKKNLTREQREAEAWESLKNIGKAISKKLERMESFQRFKEQINIELTRDGLRIQLIEASDKSSFFSSGSADMSIDGRNILAAIAAELLKLDNDVVIEGHTDSQKFNDGAEYTNWELSADRANTARRVMLASGVRESKIKEIRGFAANQPRFADDPTNPSNRRIAIIVLNEFASNDYEDVSVSSDEKLSLK